MPAKLPDVIALPYMGQANQIMHDLLTHGSISPHSREAGPSPQHHASLPAIALPDKSQAASRTA